MNTDKEQIDKIRAEYLKWKADDCPAWQAMVEIGWVLSDGELE